MRRCLLFEFLFALSLIIGGSLGVVIECEFGLEAYFIGNVYTCKAVKLIIAEEGEVVETINGDHLNGKSNTDVKVLEIDDQSFQYFPSDIENFFPNLEGMKIVSSGLKSLNQNNLKWFPDLQFCDFSDNEIESLDADLFTFNTKLKFVTFDSNKISSVGNEIFENLNDLESISLKSNECVDDSWNDIEAIATAKIEIAENCSTKDAKSSTEPSIADPELPHQSSEVSCEFSEIHWKFSDTELFTCSIANSPINHAGYEVNVSPSQGEQVKAFSLNDNQFVKYLPVNVASVFPNLVEYLVVNTYLETITAANFEGMEKLKKLNLSDNDLSVIESGTFVGLTELEQLDLSEGNIRFIEEGAFAGLTSLKSLNLEANKIRFLLPKTFEGLTELRNLSLELNHLTEIDESLFATNTKLVNIWLNGNKINALSKNTFEHLSELTFVDLQDNECIDEDYDTTNFIEMNEALDEKCSETETSTEIIIQRTVRKKYKVKQGDDVTQVDVRDEYHDIDHDATLFTFVQDVEVSGMEESGAETTTKVNEATTTKNNREDKAVSCVVGDVYWRFSESNLKTCVIADQEVDTKEFKIIGQTDGSDVKGLVMANNKLLNFLPENIGETFPNLQEFTSQNSSLVLLSKKHFAGLRHLKTLNLANNKIKFIESDAFDDLKDLEELDLSGNNLEKIDEEVFAKLKSLKTLRLSENKLHFVHPTLFRNLRNLQNISISNNQISTVDKNLFKTNQKLDNVWLQNNKIKQISTNLFDKTKTLDYVDLRDNKCIDGVYEKSVFEAMKKEILEKCGDGYSLKRGAKIKKSERKKKGKTTKKPDSEEYDNEKEIGCEYEDLYWPSLNETLFTCIVTSDQVIDGSGFRMAANVAPYNLPLINGDDVQALKFESNKKIKFLPEKITKTFPNLIAFSAVDTSLESISKRDFKKLPKLRSVNLSGNKIKSFDENTFDDLDSLEELIFDNNEIEIIEETTFTSSRKLKKLKLAGNKMKEVDEKAFELMTELVELSIDFEFDSSDEVVSEALFNSNEKLEILTLNGKSFGRDLKLIKQIETTAKTTLADSTTEKLFVDEAHQEVSCNFIEVKNLITCELDGDVEILSESSYIIKPSDDDDDKVQSFVISNNERFKSLPANLATIFPNLVEITVINSGLTGVEKKNFDGLTSLKLVNLSSNAIKHLDSETFDNLDLEVLDLSNNEMEFIEEILLFKLKSLKDLKLSSNKIHYLHPKTLKNLQNLESFSIDNNLLSVVDDSTFRQNQKLQVIDLSGNKIESLSPKLLDLKNLRSINLEGNNCIDQSFDSFNFDELKEAIEAKCKSEKKTLIGCEVDRDDNSCTVADQPIEDSDYSIHIRSPVSSINGETMERLVFNGSDIKFLPKVISEDFPNLLEISAITASLESINKETFSNLPKLKSLRLKVAELTDPDVFKGLTSLETLIIETDAEEIDEDIFSDLVSLEIFYLTSTKLRKIPRKLFENLSELSEVELTFDPTIVDTIEIEASLIAMPSIRKLNINGKIIKEKEDKPKEEEVVDSTSTVSIIREPDHQHKDYDDSTSTEKTIYQLTTRTKPTRGQRPRTTTVSPRVTEVICSLSYFEWSEPNVTLITCDLKDQKIEDAETSVKPTPYSNHVQALRIDNNKNVKFLPENIAISSPNLIRLSAENSSIEAIFKEDFEKLKKLSILDLSGNKIVSIEPETFIDLSALETLDLSDNEIDYVDENAFANLTSLKSIDLSGNKINFLHPKTFEKLLELQSINLEGNNLPHDYEDELRRNNPNLVHILITIHPRQQTTTTEKTVYQVTNEISCNFVDVYWFFMDSNLFSCDLEESLESTVTIEQSPRNRRVKGLNFIDNKNVKYLPQNLGETLPNLIGISGFNSSLQSLEPTDFANLKKLKYLNLAKNNLRRIPLNTFDDLTLLEELDLSDNQIDYLDESTFEKLSSLQTLYLGGNSLEHLPARIFEFLPNLRNISLENNKLVSIDGNIFKNNPKLENIWLNNNRIKVLSHKMFEDKNYFEYVDLQNNECIDQIADKLTISQLQLNILTNCQLKDIKTEPVTTRPDTKQSIPRRPQTEAPSTYDYEDTGPSRVDPFEEIDIPYSTSKKVSCDFDETFSTFANTNLFTCNIESQPIDSSDFSIKDVPQNNRVKRTVIDNTNVNFLPENIGESFPHLLELEVKNSSLKIVKPENFRDLRKLKVLDLSANDLKFIEPDTFDELTSLEVLSLNDNKLKCIDEPKISTLRVLNIAGNKLSFIEPKAFAKLWQLIEINLENNQLSEINGDLFRSNPSLQVVNLSNNKIKSIDPATFERSANIKIINLSLNPCIDKVFETNSLEFFKPMIQQTCQTYENFQSLLMACKREAETCRTSQSVKQISQSDETLRRENDKLRALLKKTGAKVEKLNNHTKKLRKSLTHERNILRKLRIKVKSLESENLRISSQTCAKIDDSNNFLVDINCEFQETPDDDYSCTSSNLNVENESSTIDDVTGTHIRDKRNSDVTALMINDQSMKFVPSRISNAFPNLNKLVIKNSNLRKLAPNGFKELILLVNLVIKNNKISFIDSHSFDENPNLELLDLSHNQIEEIPAKIFNSLTKLVILVLSDNKIKSLPFDIFPNQNILDQFTINNNRLETVDPRIFKSLIKTSTIDFTGNVCVDGKFSEADGDDQQSKLSLFGEIAMKCSSGKEEFCKV